MTTYTEQIERLRSNLALVESVFARYPELFAGAGHTSLDSAVPTITWWASDTPLEKRLAVVAAHRDADWQRFQDGGWISWRATICGVRFELSDMEARTRRGEDLGPVVFPEEEMIQLGQRLAGVQTEVK